MRSFQEIANISTDIIFFCDLEGNFLFANPFSSKLIGYSIDEIVGKHFSDFVVDEFKPKVYDHFLNIRSQGKVDSYFEFPVQTKGGNKLWVGQTTNMTFDEDENPDGFFGIARPITKLRSVEQTLSESEARLQSVIDSALDAVIIMNQEGTITEWNKQAEEIFGWSKDWIIGKKLSDTIVPEQYRKLHDRGMKRYLKTGVGPVLNKRIEIVAMNSKGIEFPVELTISPNEIDGVHFFSAFLRDLTDEKKSEKTLKAINQLAIELLGKNTLEEIAWEITKNTIEELGFEDCVVYVLDDETKMLHQLAAYGPKNPSEKEILDEIKIPIGKGIVGKVALEGKPLLISNTKDIPEYIVDDQARLSELAVPIIENDKVIGVIDSEHSEVDFFTEEHKNTFTTIANLVSSQLRNAIINDQRQKAEKSLRDSEERWYNLVSNQPEAIQITKDGIVVFLNPAGVELYEADSLEGIIGKNLFDIAPEELRPAFVKRLEKLKEGKKVDPIEFEITTFKGNTRVIEAASSMVIYNEEPAIQTIARDITEKKLEERKREALLKELENVNNQLSEFAHVISHDLKAPLRAISSLSEWIVEDYSEKLGEKGKQELEALVDNVEKMDQLIDGVLTYSTSGENESLQEIVDTNEIIDSAISFLNIPNHIRVEKTGEFPSIYFNKVQFIQIIQNLISNAIKFNDKENGSIRIGCNEKKNSFEFSVSDNGTGIADDIKQGVFQLFSTFHETDKSSTGIGLAIVKKILEARGEHIWYESQVAEGTTFYFTIHKMEGQNEK